MGENGALSPLLSAWIGAAFFRWYSALFVPGMDPSGFVKRNGQ